MPLHRKRRKPLLLSSTRPCHHSHHHNPDAASKTLSSKYTRTLIRQHHVLQKRLAAAHAAGDRPLASSVEAQIAADGGLAQYQRASLAGQAKTRGGDSSGVLVRWLNEMMAEGGGVAREDKSKRQWRMLDVGALRVDNAVAHSGLFATVERIDLHAQEAGIITQDFMERPLPTSREEEFDVVSLSLVLNYVGDAVARGQMLRRVEGFLKKRKKRGSEGRNQEYEGEEMKEEAAWLPGLFLVLPAPCVTNSRYLDEERLEAMMRGLGYLRIRRKMSLKLVYYFWKWTGNEEKGEAEEGMEENDNDEKTEESKGQEQEEEEEEWQGCTDQKSTKPQKKPPKDYNPLQRPHPQHPKNSLRRTTKWPKKEIHPGAKRNNFAVVLL